MLEAVNYAISFVDGVTYDQFVDDKIRFFAVMKNIEANMITDGSTYPGNKS